MVLPFGHTVSLSARVPFNRICPMSAPLKFVPAMSAWEKSAPVRFAPERSALEAAGHHRGGRHSNDALLINNDGLAEG